MKFDHLIHSLDVLRTSPIVGIQAHEAIFPNIARQRMEALQNDPDPKQSAVAAILMPQKEETVILLIERQVYKGVHSGQIGFPGGRKEETDASLEHTARRETEEEVGIRADSLKLIRSLSQVYIPPSRFLVHPFLFVLEDFPELKPNTREVNATLILPVSRLLDDTAIVKGEVPLQDEIILKTVFFSLHDKKIWGATAMMLNELKVLLAGLKHQ